MLNFISIQKASLFAACVLVVQIVFAGSVPKYSEVADLPGTPSHAGSVVDFEASYSATGTRYKALLVAAAKNGNFLAMHNLAANTLHGGNGLQKDEDEAFAWYQLAAQMGFAGSQNNLGDMYENGQGTEQSREMAIYWYTQAAMKGEPSAYWSLGTLLSESQPRESLFWLNLAIENLPRGSSGLVASTQEAFLVRQKLSVEEIKEADERAKRYQPLQETIVRLTGGD